MRAQCKETSPFSAIAEGLVIDFDGDEPPHQIHSYTLLFSLFHYFLYIIDPPLHTPTLDHTCTHFIGPISLTLWTHVLWFTCFISILSIPNVCPPTVWPIMNPRTTQSCTFYSFTLDEPYALFLVDHSYLTCMYLPFRTENHPYKFPPEFRFSTYTSHRTASAPHHFTLHHTALQLHCLYLTPHLETIPYPQIAPSEPHRIYT